MDAKESVRAAVSFAPWPNSRVVDALGDAKVQVVDLSEVADPVADLRKCKFLVAFFGAEPAPVVLVHVGNALALRKPVLIVAEFFDVVPLFLRVHPVLVSSGLTDAEIDFQISAFAKPFLPAPPVERVTVDDASIAVRAEASRVERHVRVVQPKRPHERRPGEVAALSRERFHSEAEFEVASLLAAGGAIVVPQDLGARGVNVPDLAATFGELGPGVSPLLVEVGGRRADVERKRKELMDALSARGLMLGLLVTLDDGDFELQPDRNVLVVGIRQLRQLVSDAQLSSVLRQARNHVVHQAG